MLRVARVCKSPINKGFLFPALPTIAEYCKRVRVKLGSSIVDSYTHWMPSIAWNTAEEIEEALG